MIKQNKLKPALKISGETNEMLFPNCSEVTWRLDFGSTSDTKEQIVNALMEVDQYSDENCTSDTSVGALDSFLWYLKDAKKKGLDISKIDLDITDNSGGNENFVWNMWQLAHDVMNKEISLKKAHEREKYWSG